MPTNISYGSSLKERMWRSGITVEAERSTPLMAFTGTDEYDAFHILDKPGAGKGDQITRTFTRPNDEDPKTNGDPVLGHESGTNYLQDSMFMRYFLLDGGLSNKIVTQQLTSFDARQGERSRVSRQWGELWEQWIINQLVGNTATAVTTASDYGRSGGNAPVAPDTGSWYFAPDTAANANEAAVAADSASVMTTDVIDELVMRAGSKAYREWPIAPCNTPYGQLYVLVIHGTGFRQIRQNSTATDFYDIEKAKIQGGGSIDKNSLITGEGFIYNKTLVLKSDFCPSVIANARRGAFFGANAGAWMFGEGFTDGEHLGYQEQEHLPRRWSFIVDTVSGFKVTIPQETNTANNQRFGSMVVSHYSEV